MKCFIVYASQQISRLWEVQPVAVLPVSKLTAVSPALKINFSHLLLIRFPTGSAVEPVPASVSFCLLSSSSVTFFCGPLLVGLHLDRISSSHQLEKKQQPNPFIIFFFFPLCWRLHSAGQWITHHHSCKLMTDASDKVSASNYLPNSVVLLWDLLDQLPLWFFYAAFSLIWLPHITCNLHWSSHDKLEDTPSCFRPFRSLRGEGVAWNPAFHDWLNGFSLKNK